MAHPQMTAEQELLEGFQEKFMVACNRPECDEHWESLDPEWVGKASMSKNHRFLITKDLFWGWFNVLVFGLQGNLREAVEFVEGAEKAARLYVQKKEGWSQNVDFYFHVYAHSSVNSLHLHILDLDHLGPTYQKL